MRNPGHISRLPEENDVEVDATNPILSIERILNVVVSNDSRVARIKGVDQFRTFPDPDQV
jgi:hypothetical protein